MVVGGIQVTYMPNIVNAAVGDTIQFQFSTGAHTVTQSSEMGACAPIQQAQLAPGALPVHSGHIPFMPGSTTVSTFDMKVMSKDPMFIYCSTGPHCQLGQVMVINPYVSSPLPLSSWFAKQNKTKQNGAPESVADRGVDMCRVSVEQVVAYARRSQATKMSTDGTTVQGGTVGQIPLAMAAFDPPPPMAAGGGAPPGAGAPGGGAPPAGAPPAAG